MPDSPEEYPAAAQRCAAVFRLDGEKFQCSLPVTHVYLDSSDHQTTVYWTDEITGRRHRPHLMAE